MAEPFFKLLAGSDPVGTSQGQMTQGLGFPLRDVELSTAGGAVQVLSENVLLSENFTDQNPSGLGVATGILFGGVSATDQWSMDVAGVATCLEAGDYTIRLSLTVGREGASGTSQLYFRVLINGVPFGNSAQVITDSARIEIPFFYNRTITFSLNDTLTFEMIRDTDGDNSGGLRAGIPAVAWASAPSAALSLSRTVAIEV